MAADYLSQHEEGIVLVVRLQPRASRLGIQGVLGSALKWGVSAPPLEGRANAEIVKAVAEFFDLSRSAVRLLRGEKNREKVLLLSGITLEQARPRIVRELDRSPADA